MAAREPWWHPQFEPVACASFEDFDTYMGHEIAREIQLARQAGRPIAFILPVGPMGMYRWTVYFLKRVGRAAATTSTASTWTNGPTPQGNTLPPDNPGAFQYAMEQAFYGPLGKRHRAAEAAALRPEDASCRPTPSRSPT